LIDDELANTKVSIQLICEPQHYTIYERFQDIEHALGGEELIYDLWQNWGDNRNDVQFRLKISKERDTDSDDGKAKAKVKFVNEVALRTRKLIVFFTIIENPENGNSKIAEKSLAPG
jgi:hypothetical protein